ncbi:hypothetical protein ACTFIW_013292 [Dictyostelium discoideum]
MDIIGGGNLSKLSIGVVYKVVLQGTYFIFRNIIIILVHWLVGHNLVFQVILGLGHMELYLLGIGYPLVGGSICSLSRLSIGVVYKVVLQGIRYMLSIGAWWFIMLVVVQGYLFSEGGRKSGQADANLRNQQATDSILASAAIPMPVCLPETLNSDSPNNEQCH